MAVHLEDICDYGELLRLVGEGLISARGDSSGELTIYNYTKVAQYSAGAFGIHEVRLARGLVVNNDNLVVGRGFPKFGGAAEHSETSVYGPLPVGEPYVITEKLDGSLGIVFRYNGKLLVTTRGMFDTPQAQWAQRWLDANLENVDLPEIDGETTSLCVEILSEASKVVVNYDTEELVALAAIDHASGKDVPIPQHWPGRRVIEHTALPVEEALRMVGENPEGSENREGVVIRYVNSGTRVKVKFGEYLRIHRLIAGLHRKLVWEHWATELLHNAGNVDIDAIARATHTTATTVKAKLAANTSPIADLLGSAPDEAMGLITAEIADLEARLGTHRSALAEAVASVERTERRAIAATLGNSPYTPAVFATIDGRNPDVYLVKMVEPPGEPLREPAADQEEVPSA